MGISAGSKSGAARSEINVTPLVDIVLVLLIIFLVTMPIMMKQVTLEVPRKADLEHEDVTTLGKQISILLKATGDVVISDGQKEQTIHAVDLATTLRPMLDEMKNEKLVFVDYCNPVRWKEVVSTMDQIRSIANDKDHDEVKVALKMRDKDPQGNPIINPDDGCPKTAGDTAAGQ
ncbi:MAG TPA: biopolymer transporter ExbD [Kofleriaceae bacterium]|jgi:biopolymer transport protein ExbD/biopolymer transport protein TolR|nr:biopolymer transporter ExbD [Kofleriaceae bacterium]